ncbi:MAG: glycine cleavage system protein GcvH [Acidothermales bacterium]|nr:glycine cleavage system protein GcvH [Acidothermales bacterium]
MYPEDLSYTDRHEWVRRTGGDGEPTVRIGITHYAQDALGDIVFVTLPEPGTELSAGQPLGEVESTKSVSDVYAPVAGTVVARNQELDASPDLINSDCYGEGWMLDIQLTDADELAGLMDADAYQQSIGHPAGG